MNQVLLDFENVHQIDFSVFAGRPVTFTLLLGAKQEKLDAGLVEEVGALIAGGRQLSRTARQAVGYREALGFLAGEFDGSEMVERIKARTRRFAKRQGTWFRSLSECRFVDISGDVEIDAVAGAIAIMGGAS